ncbi:MAG TPA: sensor histidine kinase [Pseudogracilibacillus sp.]|nr:sensor histidine kinase [Pseudogracilibacillus sp.]
MVFKNGSKEKTLDIIIDEMTNAVEKSKEEIFQISEESLSELDYLMQDLEQTKEKIVIYINKEEVLSKQVKEARESLVIASKKTSLHSESDIRDAYESTHNLQMELTIVRKEERQLRKRRDDLERRIIRIRKTIDHATNVGRKVSVVLSYLQEDFSQVNHVLKTAKEKQQLGLKVIEAQEIERKRLSREIHDGPAQMLAHILIRSEIIDLSLRDGKIEQVMQEVRNMRKNIRSSLKEVRRIIYDLRPMALDDLGIIPTLKKHISTVAEFNDVEIDLILLGEEKRLATDYELAVFRLIQEALQNTIKHAKATVIKVTLEILLDQVTIIIRDNGIGFDIQERKKDSFGLIGMRERVEMLDGVFIIDSSEGKGTTIRAVLPYDIDLER